MATLFCTKLVSLIFKVHTYNIFKFEFKCELILIRPFLWQESKSGKEVNHVVNEGLNFEEENSSNNFSALLFKKQEENSVKTGRNLMGGGVSRESKLVEKGRGRIISNDAEMSMLTPAEVCYYGRQVWKPPPNSKGSL